jgi:hypothetical protein
MRQNRNSRKTSSNKNLKYIKTFESFGGDYKLMLEEESWLSKTLAGLALMMPMLGSVTPTKAMSVDKQQEPIELKADTKTTADSIKTFVKTASAGKKFDLEITGFKPENVIVKEIQMNRDLFTKETVVVAFTTSKLDKDGRLEKDVQPTIVATDAKVLVVNSHADENMKLVITVSVEQTDRLDADGNVVSAKTKWTLNGEPFENYKVSPGNDPSVVNLEK